MDKGAILREKIGAGDFKGIGICATWSETHSRGSVRWQKAVLVAVSIPMFAGQLKSAREATNKANLRAAEAAAIAKYLSDKETTDTSYSYDMTKGVVTKLNSTPSEGDEKTIENVGGDKALSTITVTVSESGGATFKVTYKS